MERCSSSLCTSFLRWLFETGATVGLTLFCCLDAQKWCHVPPWLRHVCISLMKYATLEGMDMARTTDATTRGGDFWTSCHRPCCGMESPVIVPDKIHDSEIYGQKHRNVSSGDTQRAALRERLAVRMSRADRHTRHPDSSKWRRFPRAGGGRESKSLSRATCSLEG